VVLFLFYHVFTTDDQGLTPIFQGVSPGNPLLARKHKRHIKQTCTHGKVALIVDLCHLKTEKAGVLNELQPSRVLRVKPFAVGKRNACRASSLTQWSITLSEPADQTTQIQTVTKDIPLSREQWRTALRGSSET